MEKCLKIFLYLAAITTVVSGHQCYNCVFQEAKTNFKKNNEECQAAQSKFLKSCGNSPGHCLRVTGQVDGKPAGTLDCGDQTWVTILQGEDKCVPSSSVPEFKYTVNGKVVNLVNGIVCICNSDSCNGQGKILPSTSAALLLLLAGVIFSAFY